MPSEPRTPAPDPVLAHPNAAAIPSPKEAPWGTANAWTHAELDAEIERIRSLPQEAPERRWLATLFVLAHQRDEALENAKQLSAAVKGEITPLLERVLEPFAESQREPAPKDGQPTKLRVRALWMARWLGVEFAQLFRESKPGTSYAEIELRDPDNKPIMVTLQRPEGPTPRQEAERWQKRAQVLEEGIKRFMVVYREHLEKVWADHFDELVAPDPITKIRGDLARETRQARQRG